MTYRPLIAALFAAALCLLPGACNLFTESDVALQQPPDSGEGDGSGDASPGDEDPAEDERSDETTDDGTGEPDGEPGPNRCGGDAVLRFRGVDRTLGEPCGCGGTIVCAGPDALQCANDRGNNGCGGCGELPGAPGRGCGACGGGLWVCSEGGLDCQGALARNLCGGCAQLAGAPGAPCDGPPGSRWECDGDAVLCAVPDRNLCGGNGELLFDGLDALPGDACEADCGGGRLICEPSTRTLFCDGPEQNVCGGCGVLPGSPGASCGCGDRGRWRCTGTALSCEGGDTNACGGCGALAVQPGESCDDGALRICVSRDATACATFGGGTNFCGGEVPLSNLPGGACGACDTGTYACVGPDEIGCAGDRGASAFNACGGCQPLVGQMDAPCGTCGRGTLRCEDRETFVCDGDPGVAALNACGGCSVLAHAPDTACGTCAAWRCVAGGLQCLIDPGAEGCGGTRVTCAELAPPCSARNRRCVEATTAADAICGGCLDGYEDREGSCEAVPDEVLPAVTTRAPESQAITATSARLSGALENLGVPRSTQHGFCIGPAVDPALGEIDARCTTLGAPPAVGVFEETLLGLAPATAYHARAYATNPVGTAYGEDRMFQTADLPPDPPPAPAYVAATNDIEARVRVTWTDVEGATGYLLSVDGAEAIEASSPHDDAAALPATIVGCTPTASSNVFADRVALACEGASVVDGPPRQYRVIAVGPGGNSPPSAAATGRRAGGVLRHTWERSAGEAPTDFAVWSGAPTGPAGDDNTAPFDALRHYRVLLSAAEGVAEVTTAAVGGRRGIAPTVESLSASDVGPSSARMNGAVTSLGGASSALAAGFCWRVDDESSACAGPSVSQPCATGWTDTAAPSAASPFGATVSIAPGTTYAACAWATNAVGIAHGAQVRFTAGLLPPETPVGVAATVDRDSDVHVTWTAAPGATSYEVEIDGSGPWVAVDASPYIDTSAAPSTLTPCTVAASDGTSRSEVALSCTGDTARAGTSRSYRVRAVGPGGTSGASAPATGSRAAGARSYQWQRSASDSDASFSNVGSAGASAASTDAMSGIAAPAGRYFRVQIVAAGAATVTSNADRGYVAALPGVTTSAVDTSGVTTTSASLQGRLAELNATAVTQHGFCVGLNAEPAAGDGGATCSTLGARSEPGDFGDALSGLLPGMTYHVRAYATNVAGTGYGASRSFTTDTLVPDPPHAPEGLTATTHVDEHVRVTWSPVAGATGYVLRIDGETELEATSPYDDATAPAGSIRGCAPVASTNLFADRVSLSCDGAAAADGAVRQYEVIAVGPGGRSAATPPVWGRRSGGVLRYVWERSAGTAASSFAPWGGAPTVATGADTSVAFNTLRHYRVVLGAGTGVSEFTTASASGRRGVAPAVESLSASDVGAVSARLNGAVTSLGGAVSAAAAGFCWRLDDESSVCAGPSAAQPCAVGWTDTSASSMLTPFSASVTLAPGSAYVACAYATNEVGAGHGAVVRFVAGVLPPSSPTGVAATSSRASDVRVSWAAAAGATSYEVEIGNSGTWLPAASSPYTDAAAPAPALSACTATASDGTSAAEVALACSGDSVAPGATRSYRVRALGPGGTSGASASVTGNRVAGSRSYQWQRSAGDGNASFSNVGTASASAASTDGMSAVTAPDGRYFRVQISASGAAAVTSNADRGYIAALPAVTTSAVASATITTTSALVQGDLKALNSATVAQHGFCRGPSVDPAIGGSGVVCSTLGAAAAIGAYSDTLAGLTDNTTYHVRAYATNVAGTAYGTSRSFTTLAEPPSVPTGVTATTSRPGDVQVSWSPAAGATSYEVEIEGNGTWIAAASSPYTDSSAPAPSLSACTAAASDGTSATEVLLTCTGDSATPGASRSYRVRAVGPGGTSGASASVTGNRVAGARSYQWERSAGDGNASFSNVGAASASAASTDVMSTVTSPDGRYFRVRISASGVAAVTSNADRGYIAALPAVTTSAVASGTITTSSAAVEGELTALNASTVTQHGFCRGQSANPALGGSGVVCSALGARVSTGAFSGMIGGLTENAAYHVRAYATNVAGTAYGVSRTFSTLAEPPGTPVGVAATTDRNIEVQVSWAAVAGATSYEVEIDDSGTWLPVASSPYADTAAPAPKISPCTATASDGASATEVSLACSGDSVSPGASRTYRVRALGPGGTSDASASATGNRVAGTPSYQWERSAADSSASFSNLGTPRVSAAGTDQQSAFWAPAGRFFRVRIAAAGAAAVTSNTDRGYVAASPTVTTLEVAPGTITTNDAAVEGEVTAVNAANVTEHGFCRGPSADPAIGGSGVVCSTLGARASTGAFSDTLTGLSAGSTYHVRGYATNVAGTAYGSSHSFTTRLDLGGLCTTDAQCGSDLCSTDAVDPTNRRCVPRALSGAAGGAMEFRYVPPTPVAGFTQGTLGAVDDERPFTSVLTRAIFVGRSEVTQGQWKHATGLASNPSCFQSTTGTACTADNANDAGPVEQVDWWAAAAFANWLSETDGDPRTERCYVFTPVDWDLTTANWTDGDHDSGGATATGVTWSGPSCSGYRLLSESEWEWSARGPLGTATVDSTYFWGEATDSATVGTYAWFSGNSGGRAQPAASSGGNGYGLRGMNGNVWEWVWDWFATGYPVAPSTDYSGPSSGSKRVYRGGSYLDAADWIRARLRDDFQPPTHRFRNFGFRLARSVPGAVDLPLGAACAANAECDSGLCSLDAASTDHRRCAPVELPTAAGGAMEFRYVPATPAGGFTQGSPTSESGRGTDETQWQSAITRAYFVGRTEVTQGQWKAATGGTNPSCFQSTSGTTCGNSNANNSGPVEQVDWWSVAAYSNWLSELAGLERCYTFTPPNWDRTVSNWSDGDFDNGTAATALTWSGPSCAGYRLLTESEWEWAARGPVASGTFATPYYWGASFSSAYLWYWSNAGLRTQPVGGKLPNAYGLRDMSGNVWEWGWDWYSASYPSGSRTDYAGATTGSLLVFRGGSWLYDASNARSAYRSRGTPGYRSGDLGLRLTRTAP